MTTQNPRFVRTVEGSTAQTAVGRYQHPSTRRTVTVIGTALYADAAYFTAVRKVIDAAESKGAVVQCAGGRWLHDDLTRATKTERDLVAAYERVEHAERRQLRALGLSGAEDALTYQPQWQIADLSVLAMIHIAGQRGIRAHVDRAARLFEFPPDDLSGPARVRKFVALVWQHTGEDWQLDLLADTSGPAATVLLQSRIVLALTDPKAVTTDLVMVRPVIHTPGLHTGLLERGYTRDDTATRWLTVTGHPRPGTRVPAGQDS